MIRRMLATLLLTGTALGCTDGAPGGTIGLERWQVEETTQLSVGELEGQDELLFVRVNDAARLPDGGVVVLDAGAQELRLFDAHGSLKATAGRAGEGPGEFRGLFGVEVLRGDTIVAWDFARNVLSYWSTSGEFLTERAARHHRTIHEGALLPDGSVVVPRYSTEEAPVSGRYRPSAVLMRYGNGEPQELGSFPSEEMLAGTRQGAAMPFRSRSAVAAGGVPLRIAVGDDTNAPRVRMYDQAGELLMELDLHDTRMPVTPQMWVLELDKLRQAYGQDPVLERKLSDWGRPDLTPAFDDLVLDAAGRLWVLRREESKLFAVVHVGGMPVAEIEMPELAAIFEIGQDYILGLHKGALDVESVQVYTYVTN